MVKCVLNIDNQVALVAIQSKMNKSGHHLAANLYQMAQKLHKRKRNNKFRLTFRWTAGHVGIVGNEDADKLVKEAVSRESSAQKDLPSYLRK